MSSEDRASFCLSFKAGSRLANEQEDRASWRLSSESHANEQEDRASWRLSSERHNNERVFVRDNHVRLERSSQCTARTATRTAT